MPLLLAPGSAAALRGRTGSALGARDGVEHVPPAYRRSILTSTRASAGASDMELQVTPEAGELIRRKGGRAALDLISAIS